MMQWLIDIVYEKVMAKIAGPPFYVDRGDPTWWDFTDPNFIEDGAWHILDLSNIVPARARAVHFRLACISPTIGGLAYFRRAGNTNDINSAVCSSYAGSVSTDRSYIVALDSSRHIEYKVIVVDLLIFGFTIRGWWL